MNFESPAEVHIVLKTCVSSKDYATRYIFINQKSMNQFPILCMKKVVEGNESMSEILLQK